MPLISMHARYISARAAVIADSRSAQRRDRRRSDEVALAPVPANPAPNAAA
jgi:hypothetical protein